MTVSSTGKGKYFPISLVGSVCPSLKLELEIRLFLDSLELRPIGKNETSSVLCQSCFVAKVGWWKIFFGLLSKKIRLSENLFTCFFHPPPTIFVQSVQQCHNFVPFHLYKILWMKIILNLGRQEKGEWLGNYTKEEGTKIQDNDL